jgi:hypothetical protein
MTRIAIRENGFENLVDLRRRFDQLFNRLLTIVRKCWQRMCQRSELSRD